MSQALVQAVKAQLLAAGEDLSGPCGAFKITQRVSWAKRGDGFGLLDKPAGNNCRGYAVDIVVDRQGGYYDILGDGGGANTPQWPSDPEQGDVSRWRPPIDPGDAPAPPAPTPAPPDDDLAARVAALETQVKALADLAAKQAEQMAKVDNRVTALELAPPPEPAPLPDLVAEGFTSRDWGHAHRISIPVKKRG